jgi:hypothetical protein
MQDHGREEEKRWKKLTSPVAENQKAAKSAEERGRSCNTNTEAQQIKARLVRLETKVCN